MSYLPLASVDSIVCLCGFANDALTEGSWRTDNEAQVGTGASEMNCADKGHGDTAANSGLTLLPAIPEVHTTVMHRKTQNRGIALVSDINFANCIGSCPCVIYIFIYQDLMHKECFAHSSDQSLTTLECITPRQLTFHVICALIWFLVNHAWKSCASRHNDLQNACRQAAVKCQHQRNAQWSDLCSWTISLDHPKWWKLSGQ